MFQSKEQRELRRQREEKLQQLSQQVQRLQGELKPRREEYDRRVETLARSVSDKWEYIEVLNLSVEGMNKAGSAGWELVSVGTFDIIENNYRSLFTRYVFKRKVPEIPEALTVQLADIFEVERQIQMLEAEIEQLKKQS